MRKRNPIATIIFVLILVGLGYVFAKGFMKKGEDSAAVGGGSPAMEQNQGSSSDEPAKNQNRAELNGKIIYLERSENRSDVYNLDLQTEERKNIFTDADEKLKIKEIANLTSSNKMLVLMSEQDQVFGGVLYLISADGKAEKKELEKDFASPVIPSVSPDEGYLAGVIFSNAEPNFGFTLYAQNLSTGTKQEIAKDSGGISNMRWSTSGAKIAFVKGGTADNNQIMVADKDGKNVTQISESSGRALSSIDWQDDETLVFVRENEIYSYNLKDKKEDKIKSNNQEKKDLVSSPDKNGIVYLVLDAPGAIKGQMVAIDISSGVSKSFGSAEDLIGWVK